MKLGIWTQSKTFIQIFMKTNYISDTDCAGGWGSSDDWVFLEAEGNYVEFLNRKDMMKVRILG